MSWFLFLRKVLAKEVQIQKQSRIAGATRIPFFAFSVKIRDYTLYLKEKYNNPLWHSVLIVSKET